MMHGQKHQIEFNTVLQKKNTMHYQLTPRSEDIKNTMKVPQLLKKRSAFYAT